MSIIESAKKIAKTITGKIIEILVTGNACTDGSRIELPDFAKMFPKLPAHAADEMVEVVAAHEASHIVKFKGQTSEEFFRRYADPYSPDAESTNFTRHLSNLVEDRFVDEHAAKFVGKKKQLRVNKFFVWNRQGGKRPSLAELESSGNKGKCAAFEEAVFQMEIYGQIIESYFSNKLEKAAKDAFAVIDAFGRGSISRDQAMKQVVDILSKYCPPPWKLPEGHQSPRGENQEQGSSAEEDGDQSAESGSGEGESQGKSKGKDEGESSSSTEGETSDQSESSSGNAESEGGSEERGEGEGEGPGEGRNVQCSQEDVDDPEISALIRALQRIVQSRTSKKTGQGKPRWRAYAPGDVISSPDEIQRWIDDDAYGVDPFKRRAVRQRRNQDYLLAVFIDSSGSVNDQLFSKLYKVMGSLADHVVEIGRLGVGQFSGGASWVLEPTDDPSVVADFAESEPVRLYNGGTTVSEIFEIIGDFSDYSTADLIVLTDGWIEDGKSHLAPALERTIAETGCDIKLHGVIFKNCGSSIQFRRAKSVMPQNVREWVLGK